MIQHLTDTLLSREATRQPFSGSVMQLGRQAIELPNRVMDDETYFGELGFSVVEACDIYATDKPTWEIDLNKPLCRPLFGKYDVVLDNGTLEHVFHLPQALANINSMLAVGGRAIHIFPVNNYVDHGFYQFAPTLFYDYYDANGWRIEQACFTVRAVDANEPFNLHEYAPHCLDPWADCSGWPELTLDGFIVATKLASSTADKIPQQRRYSGGKANKPRLIGTF